MAGILQVSAKMLSGEQLTVAPSRSSAPSSTAAPPGDAPKMSNLEVILLVGRLLLGLALLGLGVGFVASHFRSELLTLGASVQHHFGLFGMAAGTVLAEAFQFPVPPQFYMLSSIAAGARPLPAVAAIAVGSLTGGHLGMFLARRAATWPLVRRLTERGPLPGMFRRHETLAVTLASLLPVPFSLLCYTCGVLKTPYRRFVLVCALRIPKLVVFYLVIRAGFLAGGH